MSEWKYPGHLLYSYYKPRGGWYPCRLGGWTRHDGNIKVYLDEDEAFADCPKDCRLIMVSMEFKNRGYLSSADIADIKDRIVIEKKILDYFKKFPNRGISFKEICDSLQIIDDNILIVLRCLMEREKLRLIKNDVGWRPWQLTCMLADEQKG